MKSINLDNNQIIIDTNTPNKNLPKIMEQVSKLNILINNIEIKKSNLEQVFLKLTKNETSNK